MAASLPALSITGWAKAPEEKAFYLFSHFYESEKNQTTIYGSNVTNLQWLVSMYGHDPYEFCAQLRLALTKYLDRYYDQVEVDVVSDNGPMNPETKVNFTVTSNVYEDGIRYSFGHLVEKNGKIAKLLSLINGTYQ